MAVKKTAKKQKEAAVVKTKSKKPVKETKPVEEDSGDEDVPILGDEDDSNFGSDPEMEVDSDAGSEEEDDDMESSAQHKTELEKIKESDPEFYKFMMKEDADLLNFDESDASESEPEDEEEKEDEEDGDEDGEEKKKKKKKGKKEKIPAIKTDSSTKRQVFDRHWYAYLEKNFVPDDEGRVQVRFVRLAVAAFSACLARTGADIEPPQWVVNDEQIFEAVVRLCFAQMGDALLALLGERKKEDGEENPEDDEEHDQDDEDEEEEESEEDSFDDEEGPSNKKANKKKKLRGGQRHFIRWKKHSSLTREYLTALLMFATEVQSQAVIMTSLKTISSLVVLFLQFKKLKKQLVKSMVRVWTRKTMDCRCIAYVILTKLVQKGQAEMFALVYKNMYLGFVSNSRQVIADTWPFLQFMQRTFAEITLANTKVSYQYAFTYIRQIGIHVRNALISKKRQDLVQSVYNWQLMQCLYLWTRVMGKVQGVKGAEAIAELCYPLTQIVTAVLKLFPALRFLPLRFHCLSMLVQLQVNCNIYVPTLSLCCTILEDLKVMIDRKPKGGKGTLKEVDMDCTLKVSAQHIDDVGFRQSSVDWLFRLMLQAAHVVAHQPAFRDIAFPVTRKIRDFSKECRNAEYSRLFKALADKLNEHSTFVEGILKGRNIDLQDDLSVRQTQHMLSDPNSPIVKFYNQSVKVWKMKALALQRNDTKKKEEKKAKEEKKEQKEEKKEPERRRDVKKGRYDDESDDSDLNDEEEPIFKEKKQRPKKVIDADGKKVKADASVEDKVEDFADLDGYWSEDDGWAVIST